MRDWIALTRAVLRGADLNSDCRRILSMAQCYTHAAAALILRIDSHQWLRYVIGVGLPDADAASFSVPFNDAALNAIAQHYGFAQRASLLVVPIADQGGSLGLLAVYRPGTGRLSAEQDDFVRGLADLAAVALRWSVADPGQSTGLQNAAAAASSLPDSGIDSTSAVLRRPERSTRVLVAIQDRELRYTWVNHTGDGFGARAILGLTDREVFEHSQDAECIAAIKRSVLESGVPARIELPLTINGAKGWYDLLVQRQYADANVVGVFSLAVDITDRKRTEERLRQSELRLRLALDAAYLISFEWDIRRNEVRRFMSADAVLTHTPENAPDTFENVRQFVHPEDRERFTANVYAALESPDGRYESDFRIVRSDGNSTWLYERGRVERDDSGQPLRLIGLSQDITQRKQAEEALRASEERFRLFLDNSPTIAWVKDSESRYVFLSRTYEQRFGVRLANWRGKTAEAFWPPDAAAEFRAHEAAVWAAGHALEFIEDTVNPDGSRSYWLNCRFPFRDAAGNRFIGGIGLDISERKWAEKARQIAEQRVKMEAAFRHFVATQTAAAIGHELNQPLAAIVSYIDAALLLLDAGKLDRDKLRYALENTERQAQRASQVMRQLLALLHRGESASEPVDLVKACQDGLEILRTNGELGTISVALHLNTGQINVLANRLQVEKVFVNLLRNAVEAMRESGNPTHGSIDIWIRSETGEDAMVHVTVRDQGPGLSPSAMPSLFEPFYTTKPTGLGMGLAVSRNLIESHGGKLWGEANAPAPGASFHFTLPLLSV